MGLGLRHPPRLAADVLSSRWAALLPLLAVVPFLIRSPRPVPGRGCVPVGLSVLTVLGAGFLLGRTSARSAWESCTLDLAAGAAVSLTGTAREGSPAGLRRRLTLEQVTLTRARARRSCFLPRLIVRSDGRIESIPSRSSVRVRGEWIPIGQPSTWPRRPGRTGIVVGEIRADRPPIEGAAADTGAETIRGRVLNGGRSTASARLRRLLPPDVSPIARALVLAERDDLPPAVRSRFADAGMAHLLAISGLHVGVIGGFVLLLLRGLVGPGRAAVGTAVIVCLYVAGIGSPPSAVRAAILLCGWAAARIRGLPVRTWDLLGVAAMFALVAHPLVLGEPGFQLSFAGFAGLGAGAAVWQSVATRSTVLSHPGAAGLPARLSGRLPRSARRHLSSASLALSCGVGAFLATAPIAAAHFQHVAPAALVAHFVGTPLAAAAIGALAMTLFLPPPLSSWAAGAATTVIRLLSGFASRMAGVPGSHATIAPPSGLAWVALALGAAGLWAFLRHGRIRNAVVPLAAALSLFLAIPALHSRLPGMRSLLCTLDVGQGDAALLRTASGRWILFDAGPRFGTLDAGRDVVVPLLRRYGARRIDLFVLSHPDLDHVGGFASIHRSVPVFRILDSGHPIPRPAYLSLLVQAEEDGIRWIRASTGDAVSLDNVTITVLGPAPPEAARGFAEPGNETSLLLRVSIGRTLTYLNTGDATAADETRLLDSWPADSLRADLLKVGHHGSRTSSTSEFLAAVHPSIAVISAGRGNAYGHPHSAVLDRLSSAGVPRVWRTDRDGTLCVEADDRRGWRVTGESSWFPAAGAARVLTSRRGEK